MPAESWSAQLGLVVRTVLKWLGISLLGFGVLAGLALSGFWLHSYLTYTLPKSKIEVVIKADQSFCESSPEYPVFVGFVNNSDRTVNSVDFTIEARLKGRSSNVHSYNTIRDDHIMKPSEGFGQCYRPTWSYEYKDSALNAAELEWSIGMLTVNFAE